MKIYNPDNTLFGDIDIDDKSYRIVSLMAQHNVTLYIPSVYALKLRVGCYIDFRGIRYTIRKKKAITKYGTRNLLYTVIFESPDATTDKRTVRNPVDKRLKFPYTAKPHEHIQLLVDNLNKIDSGWTVGECIGSTPILISYNHTKCREALKNIADALNTEWEIVNKTINLRKVEYNKDNPLELAYGKGNGFKTGIIRDNVDSSVPIEILAVQSGSRNIDASKYDNNTELIMPIGQTLAFDGVKFEDEEGFNIQHARTYIVDDEGLTIQRADKELVTFEDSSTDLSDIYPMRVGTVTGVEITDKGMYNIIDDTIPENLDYSKYRIAGQQMSIIFQSGMLTSRELNIMQTEDKVTGYIHQDRKFMLVTDKQDGFDMPGSAFAPEIGDTYAIFGMMLSDEYIRDDASKSGASWDLFRGACRVMYEEEQDKFSFTGELDGKWAKNDWVNIGGKILPGGYVRFTDEQMLDEGFDDLEPESVLIRQTAIKEYCTNPYKPELTLANVTAATYSSDFRKIAENEVVAETDNRNTVNFVRRSYRGMMELVNNIYSPSGSFQNDILSANALWSMMVALGDELLQFIFMDSSFSNEVEPDITYDNESGQISIAPSYVRHNTIGIDTVQPDRDRKSYLYWDIESYTSAPLMDFSDKFYYLYLRVSKAYTVDESGLKRGSGDFFMSETKVDFDSDPDNYILWVAFVNSEEGGERQITNMFGMAEFTPGMLRINNIASLDGNSYLRLLANQFRMGGDSRYLAWNVIAGLLEIKNADIEMRNVNDEIVVAISGNTGAAVFAKGSAKFNADGSIELSSENPTDNSVIGISAGGMHLKDNTGHKTMNVYNYEGLPIINLNDGEASATHTNRGATIWPGRLTVFNYPNSTNPLKGQFDVQGSIMRMYDSNGAVLLSANGNTDTVAANNFTANALVAKGITLGTKMIENTTETWTNIDKLTSLVVSTSSARQNVTMPSSVTLGWVVKLRAFGSGIIRVYPPSGHLLFNDTSSDDYIDIPAGYMGECVYLGMKYVDGGDRGIWMFNKMGW